MRIKNAERERERERGMIHVAITSWTAKESREAPTPRLKRVELLATLRRAYCYSIYLDTFF